ncbi:MAG: GntR family transcriptional regulator [Clostridia bacterium]
MDEKLQDTKMIRQALLKKIRDDASNNEKRLPPEAVLAETMGVSRTLIRDCMATLECDGYISRRQGIGTLINQHVLDVPVRMDFEPEFCDRVRAMGYEPETSITDISTVQCDSAMAKKFGVGENTPVLRVSKLVKASGRTAIYCIDHISFQTIKRYDYTAADMEEPIFAFLRKFCNTDVYLDLTVVNAVVADEMLSGIMGVAVGSPLLNMDELGYNIEGDPVLWSLEYYVPGVLEYTVLRKRQ